MSLRPADRTVAWAAAVLAVLGFALAGAADARTSDRNQPMDIGADHGTLIVGNNGQSVLTGNVTIAQGSLNVVAAKAVIDQANGELSRAQMSGGVTLKQVLDDGSPISVTSSNVDYNLKTEVVVFTGKVTITQPRGTLNGERVVYNMKSGQVESGGAGNGRVKMRILPKSAQPQPAQAQPAQAKPAAPAKASN